MATIFFRKRGQVALGGVYSLFIVTLKDPTLRVYIGIVPKFASTTSSFANALSRTIPLLFVIRLLDSRAHVLKSTAMIPTQRSLVALVKHNCSVIFCLA